MAEEEESFENLDDLDWSDVESELKANRDQILSEVKSDEELEKQEAKEVDSSKDAGDETASSNSWAKYSSNITPSESPLPRISTRMAA